ncbi:hypothetical protein V1512DRAFT_267444 [Lipomyces arxii]|uniref:uncharacterized protein n=1 Tax=Lipomyces arxii TaxID=56418 RepID=UPI0034CE5B09
MRKFRSARTILFRSLIVLAIVCVILIPDSVRTTLKLSPKVDELEELAAPTPPPPPNPTGPSKAELMAMAHAADVKLYESEFTMETDEPPEDEVRVDAQNQLKQEPQKVGADGIIDVSEDNSTAPAIFELDEIQQQLVMEIELTDHANEQFAAAKIARGHRNVYVINSLADGFERVLPFLNGLSLLRNTTVSLYAFADGYNQYGMLSWLEECAKPQLLHLVDMTKIGGLTEEGAVTPDLVVLASCVQDLRASQAVIEVLLTRGVTVMCAVNEPKMWNLNNANDQESPYKAQIEFMKQWVDKDQWIFVTMTTSVKQYVAENFGYYLNDGERKFDTQIVYPLFRMPEQDVEMECTQPYAVIPGNVELWKDNQRILDEYTSQNPHLNLRLIGKNATAAEEHAAVAKIRKPPPTLTTMINGKPKVVTFMPTPTPKPDIVDPVEKVAFQANMDYPDYYRALRRAVLTVPAKERGTGYKSRVSSALMAGVVAATPPLIARDMLQANSFLSNNNTWIRHDSESAVDAIARIGKTDKKEWMSKKLSLAVVRNRLILENLVYLESVLTAMPDVDRKVNTDFMY